MIVLKGENIKSVVADLQKYYPETHKKRPTIQKIRANYYAILESKSDKQVIRKVRDGYGI